VSFPTLTFFPEDADVAALDLQRNPAANGWNRQHGHCLIDADSDVEAVRTWLKEYRDRPRTLDSYRKEAERFLLWSAMKRGKNLSDINRDDVLEYGLFLRNRTSAGAGQPGRASIQSGSLLPNGLPENMVWPNPPAPRRTLFCLICSIIWLRLVI
jgi:hypothetical protein